MKITAILSTEEVLNVLAAHFASNGYTVEPNNITIDEDWNAVVEVNTATAEVAKPKATRKPKAVAEPEEVTVAPDLDEDTPPFDTGEAGEVSTDTAEVEEVKEPVRKSLFGNRK